MEQLEDRVTPSITSVFELDANVATTTTHDWDQVFADVTNGTTTSGAIASAFITDAVNTGADDIFTGGGSKDTQGIQDGQWLFTDSKPQAKNDITHAYAAAYTDPATGNLLLYVGLDRFDNSGDATVGFWFFRNQIGQDPTVTTNGGHPFVGEHADGDILLVSDFTQGGSVSTIKVFRWTGDDATGSLVAVADIPGTTFATVNGSPINVPWSYINKSGQNSPAAGEFFEGGVDLTALGLTGCFSSFLAETRSSQSPTATLSDFVLGSFNLCSIEVPPIPDGLSKVGDSFTYPLTVQNTGAFTLYIQNVTDTLLGNIVLNGQVQSPVGAVTSIDASALSADGSLAPGASVTIFVTRTVQAGDPDPTVSTVTFVYNDEADFSGEQITDSTTTSVNLFQPSATMTVTASPTTATSLGQVITYTYTVNNTSSADSPNLVLSTSDPSNSFGDTLLGNLEADAIAAGGGSVAPGGSFTFTKTRAVQAGDPTPLTNTATVAFTLAQNLGSFPNIITAQASSSVTLLPHLTITKAPTDGVDVIHPGDTASFTITVTNDGAGPATNVVVTDQLPEAELLSWTATSSSFTAAVSSGDFLTASLSKLEAGATATIVVSAAIPLDIFGTPEAGGTGNLPAGPFELDGNALNDPDVDGDDWSNALFGNFGSSFAHTFVTDAVNSRDDDIFTGGGSKDVLGIQGGRWLFTDSKPQAKDDIAHAFAAAYTDPSNGHTILYAGLDRYDNSGAATVGFWFFVNPVGQNPNVTTQGGHPFVGTHSDGDILLVSDFTVGGSVSTIKVFRWTGDDATGSLVAVTAPPGTTFATVNGSPISVPWSFSDKSKNSGPAAGEFFEGGVDLTALGLGGCFSNFMAETRSSQSPTATLSDFVLGNFNTCRLDLPNMATVSANGIAPITTDQVVITVLDGDMLQAESVGGEAGTAILTTEQLRTMVSQAIDEWRAAGIDPGHLSTLDLVTFHVGNLPGSELGLAAGGEIWIDRDAAGWGWSTDGAAGRMDLAIVVAHELGHVLGFEHHDGGVMEARLAPEALSVHGAADSTSSVVLIADSGQPSVVTHFVPPSLSSRTLASDAAFVTAPGGGFALSATSVAEAMTTGQSAVAGALVNFGRQTPPPVSTTATARAAAPAVTDQVSPTERGAGHSPPQARVQGGSGDSTAGEPEAVPSDDPVPPADVPVDPEPWEQFGALSRQQACDACFADESWMAGRGEESGPVQAPAAALVALGVLGCRWGAPQMEIDPRRRRRLPG